MFGVNRSALAVYSMSDDDVPGVNFALHAVSRSVEFQTPCSRIHAMKSIVDKRPDLRAIRASVSAAGLPQEVMIVIAGQREMEAKGQRQIETDENEWSRLGIHVVSACRLHGTWPPHFKFAIMHLSIMVL